MSCLAKPVLVCAARPHYPVGMGARRWLVSGRVQGVGFRNYVQKHALKNGLSGYAKNLEDGSVEVHAVGEDTALQILSGYVRRGPMLADVRTVDEQVAEHVRYDGFHIR
nr:acylphosphatase [Bryobacter aggregatus]